MDLSPLSEICRSSGVVEGVSGFPPGPMPSGRFSEQSMAFTGGDFCVEAKRDRLRSEFQCHQVSKLSGMHERGFGLSRRRSLSG